MSDPSRFPHLPLWPLVLITLSGTSAMHMFVPALPMAMQDLATGSTQIQLTISIYIAGLGLGQLVYGPVADSFGRRPALLFGLALFTLGGLVAAFAPNVGVLVGARLFQALGGCAGLLLPRAIVRDTSGAERAVKRLALLSLMTSVGPALAPLLGGALAGSAGWRTIFLSLTALGASNLLLAWKLLPETGTPTRHISMASVAADYRSLLGSARFMGFSVGGGCATTAFYAFITAAPFIFVQQLHRSPHEAGLYLGLMVLGSAVGNALASQLISRMGIERLMLGSHAVSVACAFGFLLSVWLSGPDVPLMVGLMFLYSVGAGACSPTTAIQAMGVDTALIGSAAGLYGCTQMAIGALCTLLVALSPDAALAAGTVLVGAGVLGQLAFRTALRRG